MKLLFIHIIMPIVLGLYIGFSGMKDNQSGRMLIFRGLCYGIIYAMFIELLYTSRMI